MKVENVLQTIGNTPHVRINRLFGNKHNVYIKLEKTNPGASIKDRIALAMIEDAETKGLLNKNSVIIEPHLATLELAWHWLLLLKGIKLFW